MKFLRVSRQKKNGDIFPAGLFFLVLQVNVYRCSLIPRKLPCPKKILVTRLTKPYAKQNQSNLLSKLYTDHNTLWVKHATHQKAESLRATLFQSQTTRSTTTLSSIQSTLKSLQNGRCSFIFRALFVQTITSTFSTKNPFLYFSQFSLPYSTLTRSQIHPYNPH